MAISLQSATVTYRSNKYFRICVSNMLFFFAHHMLMPTLPLFLSSQGTTEAVIGMTTAIIAVAAVIIRLFTGYGLARFNRRAIAMGGTVVFALAALGYSVSAAPEWVALNSFVLGAAWGVMTVTYATIVAELIPAGQQGAGVGTFMIFALASMATGPFAGAWLFNGYGPWTLFATSCGIALLSIGVYLWNGRQSESVGSGDGQRKAEGRCRAVRTAGAGAGSSFASTIFEKTALFPALLILLFMVSFGGILSFAGLFGQQLGLTNGGIFLLLSNIAALAVRPVAGKLFDTKGHASVLVPGSIIAIVALLLLSVATTPATFLSAAVVFGLAVGTLQPYLLAWTVQRAAPERQGVANGTFMIGMDTGVALGSMTLGLWAASWGYAAVFRIAAAVVVVQLVIYLADMLRERGRGNKLEAGRTG